MTIQQLLKFNNEPDISRAFAKRLERRNGHRGGLEYGFGRGGCSGTRESSVVVILLVKVGTILSARRA